MKCSVCGSDNPEQAVFCKHCGRRLDGFVQCKSCGQFVPQETFCINCGQRLDGFVQCKNCGHFVPQETFCINCGSTFAVQKEQSVRESAATHYHANIYQAAVKKVLGYISIFSAIIISLLTMIFVFFTGIKTSVSMGSGSTISDSGSESYDLFYWFGEAYKDIDLRTQDVKVLSDFYKNTMYIPAIFGTIIAALTLIAVISFSIASLVMCVKKLLGQHVNNIGVYSVAAFVSYLVGALLLYALISVDVKIYESSYSMTSKVSLSDVTVAGLSVSGALVGVYAVSMAISAGKQLFNGTGLIRFIFGLIGTAVAIIIFAVLSKPVYSVKVFESEVTGNLKFGFLFILTILQSMCLSPETAELIDNKDAVATLSIFSFIFMCVLLVFVGAMLVKSLGLVTGSKQKAYSNLSWTIVLTAAALLMFIFAIVTANQFCDACDCLYEERDTLPSDNFSFGYIIPIVALVFSVVMLVINVVQTIFHLTIKKAE